MPDLPTGTVTFLFTDVEGSTRLWEQHPAAMRQALARHDAIVETEVARHGGVVVRPRGEGDSRFAVFARASDAVAAAVAIQQALHGETWPLPTPLRVRMALHTGEADLRDGDYYGSAVNRCARLRAVAHGGQALLSGVTARLAGAALGETVALRDLGPRRLRDLGQPEQVFQVVAPGMPDNFPPLLSLDALPNNLPLQVTSFIGRQREVAEVTALLGRSRLVTLTGTGGAGKTRLALQAAAELLDRYPDGVWFLDLAPLADPAALPRTALAVLRVAESPGQPLLTALLDCLQTRRTLLVLDNCEHLIAACAELADQVVRHCPSVHILATSRELLGVPGEAAWRVPSLALPRSTGLSLDELLQYEAVQLFVDRARLARADFAVTAASAPALLQVCQRLDGIPLAIELAAARVRVLPVEQVAARLHDRFRLLTGGGRTALRRQQTLQALVDWSHDLLPEAERRLFRRLAVFAGGWSLAAAEEVCAGDGIEADDVLDLLTSLVDKSLVVAELQGEQARYRFLETIRQYAGEKLRAAGEAAALRDRHRDWFRSLAATVGAEFFGSWSGSPWGQLEAERDNLRAALGWRRESAVELGLAMAADLAWFWSLSYVGEGVAWLEEFLAAAPARTPTRVSALLGLEHILRVWVEDAPRAWGRALEGLSIARELGDERLVGEALSRVGLNEANAGDYPAALAHLEESLVFARTQHHPVVLMNGLRDLGIVCACAGDLRRARLLLEESIAIARSIGATAGEVAGLARLGVIERAVGDLPRARTLIEEGIRLNAIGHMAEGGGFEPPGARHLTRGGLGNLARSEGRFSDARALLQEGLRRAVRDHAPAAILHQVCSLGILVVTMGDHARGTRLIAASASPTGLVGTVHAPDLRIEGPAALARAREALGEAAYAAAWAAGQAMTLEQAIAYALEEPEQAPIRREGAQE